MTVAKKTGKNLFMQDTHTLIFLILILLTLVNIPFGMARSIAPRFSRKWGRCIYIPILLSVIIRRIIMVSYKLIPLFLVATIVGQIIGGRIQKKKAPF